MFTGIIEDIGTVAAIDQKAGKWEFTVRTSIDVREIGLGDSIAVDGVCLTVIKVDSSIFVADASLETLGVTTLKGKKTGSRVNIERAMKADGRFGGHIVMGHVDCVGVIRERKDSGDSRQYTMEVPREISRYIVRKGSVTIDGISLTVNNCRDNTFTVNIIPFTYIQTTIAEKSVGDTVNIETDIIGKYVESFLSRKEKIGADLDFLYKYGYLKGD